MLKVDKFRDLNKPRTEESEIAQQSGYNALLDGMQSKNNEKKKSINKVSNPDELKEINQTKKENVQEESITDVIQVKNKISVQDDIEDEMDKSMEPTKITRKLGTKEINKNGLLELEPRKRSRENHIDRRRMTFDLRTNLHKDLKLVCLLDDTNMYEVIEWLIERYVDERKQRLGIKS